MMSSNRVGGGLCRRRRFAVSPTTGLLLPRQHVRCAAHRRGQPLSDGERLRQPALTPTPTLLTCTEQRRHHHRQRGAVVVAAAPPQQATTAVAAGSGALGITSISKGTPDVLGPSRPPGSSATNFAAYSAGATSMSLVLRLDDAEGGGGDGATQEVPMNRTGDVWHVAVDGLPPRGVLYTLRVAGKGGWESGYRWDAKRLLLDPRAPLVAGRRTWAQRDALEDFQQDLGSTWWGTFDFAAAPFDWGGAAYDAARPRTALKDLVIYEASVRCFTADASSGVAPERRGTYLGVADKAPYLAGLGVNAVELLPVFEYDELELQRWRNPRDHMVNVWGYSHVSFMAPMSRFGTPGAGPARAAAEFKEMVKTLHGHGIQVILDVVYNHTAELDDKQPYLISMRGIDNRTYYMVDADAYVQLVNLSGCGNTVNANHPAVQQLVVDSLVRFVEEFHVDGFRFDLASCLCRDSKGNPLPAPPLIRAIAKHPVLSKVHLIAEPWDLGMYQVGSFPNWDVWAEWNGKYRDDVRRFVKGEAGCKGAFATRVSGSADLYARNARTPAHSVNFVTAHDGFSLHDLVSYNHKHNEANGEGNNDGSNDNFSWNCGVEGDTRDAGVLALRYRMMRNYLAALLLSVGTPMLVMGDEVAVTHHGNNNWYGHDTELAHMRWPDAADERRAALLRFTSELIKFRRACPQLCRDTFPSPKDITWHETNWDNPDSRFLAWTLHGHGAAADVYVAFNAHGFEVRASLPKPPQGRRWARLVDTNLPPPRDFTPGGNSGVEAVYGVAPHSAVVLIAKPL